MRLFFLALFLCAGMPAPAEPTPPARPDFVIVIGNDNSVRKPIPFFDDATITKVLAHSGGIRRFGGGDLIYVIRKGVVKFEFSYQRWLNGVTTDDPALLPWDIVCIGWPLKD
ncbi:MAG TPA: hypothetical protein VF585_11610 [Chthoniobacterales bacterium]|jgi:hypothetical protein